MALCFISESANTGEVLRYETGDKCGYARQVELHMRRTCRSRADFSPGRIRQLIQTAAWLGGVCDAKMHVRSIWINPAGLNIDRSYHRQPTTLSIERLQCLERVRPLHAAPWPGKKNFNGKSSLKHAEK